MDSEYSGYDKQRIIHTPLAYEASSWIYLSGVRVKK